MSEKGTMTVILSNGTKFHLDYDERLFDQIKRASDRNSMGNGGDIILIQGENWPVEIEFPVSQLYSIQVTKIENMCFYPEKVEV